MIASDRLRARERKITMHDLGEFSDWLAEAPTVPRRKMV
jgi:hypothetical protein